MPMEEQSAPPDDSLGLANAELTERLAHAMAATAHAYVVALVRELARRGYDDLTPSSARLLSRIEATGSRATSLAKILGRTKQAIGQTVTELELRGYVERVADPRDARARLIRRTPRGTQVLAAGSEIRRDLDEMMVAALGTDELQQLEHGLAKVIASFQASRPARI